MIGSRAGEGLWLTVPYWDRWVTNCMTVQSELLFTLPSEWRGCDTAVLMRTWNRFSWLINRASPPSGGIYSVTGECSLCNFSVSSESGPAKGNRLLGAVTLAFCKGEAPGSWFPSASFLGMRRRLSGKNCFGSVGTCYGQCYPLLCLTSPAPMSTSLISTHIFR